MNIFERLLKMKGKKQSRKSRGTTLRLKGNGEQKTAKNAHEKKEQFSLNELNLGNNVVSLNVPKKEGTGEDADPLALLADNVTFVGVFDGMGGSGATEYNTPNGVHTGAYFASRRVCNTCKAYIKDKVTDSLDVAELSAHIKNDLTRCMEDNCIKPSGLRSAIIRILPTTLAIVGAYRDGMQTHVTSYWCGDSRNYIWTRQGLLQVSTDDLKHKQDPLENLRNDEVLSNCICQDKPFEIHKQDCGVFTEPIMIMSATDGCFGYIKSPMHFEYLLLKTLQVSNNCSDWKRHIEEYLSSISGDDYSLSIAMIGENFEYWKEVMAERLQYIEKRYIAVIDRAEYTIADLQEKTKIAKERLYDVITSLWDDYKKTYMSQMKEL